MKFVTFFFLPLLGSYNGKVGDAVVIYIYVQEFVEPKGINSVQYQVIFILILSDLTPKTMKASHPTLHNFRQVLNAKFWPKQAPFAEPVSDAPSHLYKRPCPSVDQSVGPSVGPKCMMK